MSISQLPEHSWLAYTELQSRIKELSRRMNLLTEMEAKTIESDAAPKFTFSADVAKLDIPSVAGVVASLAELKEDYDESIDECEAEKTALEAEIKALEAEVDELTDFFDSVVGGSTFTEKIYGYFDDGSHGSLTTYLSITSTFNPATSTVTMYGFGYVTIVGDPRIAGTLSTISAHRQYNAAGNSWLPIANSAFGLSTSNPNVSETTTSSYDPAFSDGGGYVYGSKQAQGTGSSTFTWSPLPPST